ncbi:MAG TPA: MlaD family protein [Terriglobia bacterium]|nr:MlaD family protein [Terriglobia bacterium]
MPQRKELTWSQLRVGLMVAVALIILVVGLFFVSGHVGFFTSQYTLKAYFPEAQGLQAGAAVQLAGVPVGSVSDIRLSPYKDPKRAVLVVMRIGRRYQPDIRGDSVASIETAGLLGEGFVDITRGTVAAPEIAPSSEVKTQQSGDIKQIVQNANDVLTNLTDLSNKLNDVTNQITTGKGTVGKFIYDASLYNRMDDTVAKLQDLMDKVSRGQGTLGQLVSNDALIQKFNGTLDRANGLMDQIQHGNGTVGKLLNNPSVYDNLDKTITEARDLVTSINQGNGTLGKLAKDPQLFDRMNEAAANIDTITGRMAKGQGSLGLLSTDTKLYNNLTDSSESLREFLDEFRKTPKKYLTLHVHVF